MNNQNINTEQFINEWQNATKQLAPIMPAVSIFGSARLPENTPEYAMAQNIAHQLSNAGFAILTGGGGSIMEAANKGAFHGKSAAVGLNIVLPHEQQPNPYQNISLQFQYFATRKATFVQHSVAFIAMAGGFGTLDELFDLFVQMQTQKITPRPIILVGSTFWQGLVEWLNQHIISRGLANPNDINLLTILDDADTIVQHIITHTSKH